MNYTDWDKIREGLRNTTWPTTEDQLTAQEAWRALRSKVDSLTEEHVPTCIFKPRKSDWMTGAILREVRKKRRKWKKRKKRRKIKRKKKKRRKKRIKRKN